MKVLIFTVFVLLFFVIGCDSETSDSENGEIETTSESLLKHHFSLKLPAEWYLAKKTIHPENITYQYLSQLYENESIDYPTESILFTSMLVDLDFQLKLGAAESYKSALENCPNADSIKFTIIEYNTKAEYQYIIYTIESQSKCNDNGFEMSSLVYATYLENQLFACMYLNQKPRLTKELKEKWVDVFKLGQIVKNKPFEMGKDSVFFKEPKIMSSING